MKILFYLFVIFTTTFSATCYSGTKDQFNIEDLPVSFRKNAGQWNSDILYKGSITGWGAGVNFMKDGLNFGFSRKTNDNRNVSFSKLDSHEDELLVWNLKFVNCNKNVRINSGGETNSYANYFIGKDAAHHAINVPDCKTIYYTGVYPKIDLRYYGNESKKLKYDFIIHAGGHLTDIHLACNGIKKLHVNENGSLGIETDWGILNEDIPESYQIINGKKVSVKVKYYLINDTSYSFRIIGSYDPAADLIIDPITVTWATYVGGGPNGGGTGGPGIFSSGINDITRDAAGNIYACGLFRENWPTTAGSYKPNFTNGVNLGSTSEAVIFKLNPGGSALIYSTYLAGFGPVSAYLSTTANEIEVTPSGEVVVSGLTGSPDFPVTAGVIQSIYNPSSTTTPGVSFLSRLNATGNSLIYSTFLQGEINLTGMCLNSNEDVFICGSVAANSGTPFIWFPGNGGMTNSVSGSYDDTPNGNSDGIFFVVNKTATSYLYATYLGGSGNDACQDIALNLIDEVYITGITASTNFPVTPGAYQSTFQGGNSYAGDAFVTKFSYHLPTLVYSTYLGGSGDDEGLQIEVNAAGNAFVSGTTQSLNFPVTNGTSHFTGAGFDGFAARLDNTGQNMAYGTYLSSPGASCGVFPIGMDLNNQGELYVLNYTYCTQATTCGALQTSFSGDAWATTIIKLSTTGNRVFSSHIFNSNGSEFLSRSVSPKGILAFKNNTCQDDIIVGINSSSTGLTGSGTGFMVGNPGGGVYYVPYIAKLSVKSDADFTFSGSVCGSPVSFTNNSCTNLSSVSSYYWDFGDGSYSNLQNPFHAYAAAGTYNVKFKTGCPFDSITKSVNITGGCCALTLASGSTNNICSKGRSGIASVSVTGGGSGPYTYIWSTGATAQTINNIQSGIHSVTVTNGSCTGYASVIISEPTSTLTVSTNHSACGNGTATAISTGGTYSYSWNNGALTSVANNLAPGTYTVVATESGGCKDTATAIIIDHSMILSVGIKNNTCEGKSSGNATVHVGGGTAPYFYFWNTIPVQTTQTASGLKKGNYIIIVTDSKGCQSQTNVFIDNTIKITASGFQSVCDPNPGIQLNSILINPNTCGPSTLACSGTPVETTVGTGNSSTDTFRKWNSLGIFSGDFTADKVHWFIRKNGLVAYGLKAGVITKLSYFVVNKTTTTPFDNFTVKMGACDSAYGYNSSKLFTVYTSKPYTTVTGWTDIIFDTPYEWDGTQNIEIEIAWNNTSAIGRDDIALSFGNYPGDAFVQIDTITGLGNNSYYCGGGSGWSGIPVMKFTYVPRGVTYNWTPASGLSSTSITNPISTFSASTTYTITACVDSKCSISDTVSIVVKNCALPSVAIANASVCPGGCANLTAVGSNGQAPYNYLWSDGKTGAGPHNFCPGASSTYTVTITDINSNTSTASASIILKSPPSITVNSVISPNCYGYGTGSSTITASGGTGSYTYSWYPVGGTASGASFLPADVYTVVVTDGGGCTAQSTITITQPSAITTPTISITNAACGQNNGQAVANSSGGTGTLTYIWSNGFTGATNNTITANTYSLTVKDNNGCSATASAIVANTNGPTIMVNSTISPNCYGNATGSTSINASGGAGGYTYSWYPIGGTGSTASFLPATIYTVVVTDASGCVSQSTIAITEPSQLIFASPIVIDASCGLNDGSASISASAGTGALNYLWSNSVTGQTISAVGASTYFVTVSDLNGCTTSTSVLINSNPSAIIDSVKKTNLTCKNSANGNAIAYASGGVGMLTYSWSNSVSGSTVSSLTAATYIVSVTDASGCLTQSSVVITQPTAVGVLSANAISSSCGNSNGSADIKAKGGTGSVYTYSWSNSQSTVGSGQSTISNLVANTYSCTVTDQNNCSYIHTFYINDKPAPKFSGSSPTITAADCKGNSTGSIDVLISSGTTPYTYSWSSGQSTVSSSQSTSLTNLQAGNYSLTITDNNGCTVDTSLTLSEPSFVFTSTVTAVDATCLVGGDAMVNVGGGNIGNYTYLWSGGVSSITNSVTQQRTNLPSGNYFITVTDSKGCTTTTFAVINPSPNAPVVQSNNKTDVDCNGNSTGIATVTVTGGSGAYTYVWSGGITSITNSTIQQFNNLSAGTYSLTVTDNNGCSTTTTTSITQPSSISLSLDPVNTTCGNQNGSVTAAVAGGTSGYTYNWSNGISSITNSTNQQINNLLANNYTLTVIDAKGCVSILTTSVGTTALPNANATASATIITQGSSTNLNATGGTSFLWTPASDLSCSNCQSPIANPTSNTTYTVVVTDANSCKDTAFITINVELLKECGDAYLPIAFSPNGDGENDVLYVRGNVINNVQLLIYDRWGNKVFETTDAINGWDGRYNGKEMDTGVYVYYLNGNCIKTGEKIRLKGNITLVK